jgi:uncharacterized protein YkwD
MSATVAVLAFAALGCGSQIDQSPRAERGPAERDSASSGGPLRVAAVDGRVGDATTASSQGGLQELAVRRRANDPDAPRHGVGAGAACADVDITPAADNLAAVAAATLCLVNGERADAGLPPLAANEKLDRSSIAHSQDMVAGGYFAHQSTDGRDVSDRVRATGYIPSSGEWTVGENLAWGIGPLGTPAGIVGAWMNSQGHRDNILRSGFREVGLGVVVGTPRANDGMGATYTMNFGSTSGSRSTRAASSLTVSTTTPRVSDATRRAAARRAAARRRACRSRALRARASVRRARLSKCARAARRLRQ